MAIKLYKRLNILANNVKKHVWQEEIIFVLMLKGQILYVLVHGYLHDNCTS